MSNSTGLPRELILQKLDAYGRRAISGDDAIQVEVFVQLTLPVTAPNRQQVLDLLKSTRWVEHSLIGVTSVGNLKRLVALPFVAHVAVSSVSSEV
jgi:hypothetical protein